MRASHADRDRAVGILRLVAGEGRLSVEFASTMDSHLRFRCTRD
ncbi:MAG: DUF1707 domain-containing protein [Catenulispora sp.]